MKRVSVLIDGFNLYHSLENNPELRSYKWLNVTSLAKSFLRRDEELVSATFFTTVVTWSKRKEKKHRTYLCAVEWGGANVILGEFHKRSFRCRKCGDLFRRYEEKQTDVNIAVELLRQAHGNVFDTAIIISGDSDLIAALNLVHELHPEKKLVIAIPPNRRAEQLKAVADFHIKIRAGQIADNQLPQIIDLPNGRQIISPYK